MNWLLLYVGLLALFVIAYVVIGFHRHTVKQRRRRVFDERDR